MFIVLEGLDQSGKKTQAKLLLQRLVDLGYEVEMISFPDYSTFIGKEIKAFLKGERVYDPHVRQILYVANRWERKADIEMWLKERKIVIADRYIPSGLAYGLANGLDLGWMLSLEKGLPEPNLIIVLDIPFDVALKRKVERDVYERDVEFLRKVRESYLMLAEMFGWKIIDANKPIDNVQSEIWKLISPLLEKA